MRRLRKNDTRWRRVRFTIRIHAWITGVIVFSYAFVGLLWGPDFLLSGVREFWHALAEDVIVSAVVPPPPSVPVVTVTATCPTNVLSINLDWADDEGATSFDVYRDGFILVSGLTSSSYIDTSVSVSTEYSYVVVAFGPMDPSMATSDLVSVTTPSDCLEFVSPTLSIETVGDMNVSGLSSVSLSDTAPLITGTSNMPNASVSIALVGSESFYALLSTNINGYWSWTPSVDVSSGTYTLTVTVTHPILPLQTATDTLTVIIEESESETEEDNDEGGGHHKKKKHSTALVSAPIYRTSETPVFPEKPVSESPKPFEIPPSTPSIVSPMMISIDVLNPGNWVFQWRSLETKLSLERLHHEYDGTKGEITYEIFDANGESVAVISRTATVREGAVFYESIPIPRTWKSGEYRLLARLRIGSSNIETETIFRVVELPIFDFGGGMMVTWNDLLRTLGWMSFWSLLFLLLLLLLFVREYWLYLHSAVHITEAFLRKKGFFGSGKEVGRS